MSRNRAVAAPPLPQSITDMVKAAEGSTAGKGEGRRRGGIAFSLTTATGAERWVAPLLGLYLGWAVARIPEIFPALAVPRLPMMLLLVFMALLAFAVPVTGWRAAWRNSQAFRLTVFIGFLAVATAPLGIWIAGSIEFLKNRYVIAFVLFLACFLFLRDRRNMRVALSIYILCLALIAAKILLEWDPDRLVEFNGELVPMSSLRADLQRADISLSLDPNDYGAVVATSVPLALWLSVGSFVRRLFWTSLAVVMIVSVAVTGSRGALLGIVAVACTLLFVGATGWKRSILLVIFGIGAVGISAAATTGMMDRFLDFGTDDYNVAGNEGRLFFWRQGMVWMLKRPWGYGISNFPTFFGWMNGPDRAAHSMWVQYGMELGVAALVAVIMLASVLIRGHYRNRQLGLSVQGNRVATETGESEAALSGHLLAMLAGCLVTGTFLSNAYYPLTYMAFGIAAAGLLGTPYAASLSAGPLPPAGPPKSPPAGPRQGKGAVRLPSPAAAARRRT